MLYHTIILAFCAVVLIAGLLFQSGQDGVYIFGFRPPLDCFLYQNFGVKCALCGMTRSLCSCAHGDFRAGMKFHTIGPAIFAFICLQIPYRIWAIFIHPRQVNGKLEKANAALFVTLLAAVFINWVIYLGGLVR